MDRNGKKPKAARDDAANPERSDTKSGARDASELARGDGKRGKGAGRTPDAPDKSGGARRGG
jgi:hypothetical protein